MVIGNTICCVNVAFVDELAKICSHDGMDVYEAIKIYKTHPRVNIFNACSSVGCLCISANLQS